MYSKRAHEVYSTVCSLLCGSIVGEDVESS